MGPTYAVVYCVDMSLVFDAMERSTILDALHRVGCNDDELRLVRLLADTRLNAHQDSVACRVCNLDWLPLFAIYLAAAQCGFVIRGEIHI